MNLKTLRKKIEKLESRLKEGPQKLAKLKRKMDEMTKEKARKAERKLAAEAKTASRPAAPSPSTQKKKRPATAQRPAKTAVAQKPTPAKKVKKKLNLSPERRAQLAAAMKARWAAKRAAGEGNSQNAAADGGSASPEVSPAP